MNSQFRGHTVPYPHLLESRDVSKCTSPPLFKEQKVILELLLLV